MVSRAQGVIAEPASESNNGSMTLIARAEARQKNPARRELLAAIASAAIAASASATAAGATEAFRRTPGVNVLVAYFSRTGNTRVIAHQIRRAHGADIFEIEPADAYPDEYEATVRQAERESASGYEPPLRAGVPDIRAYLGRDSSPNHSLLLVAPRPGRDNARPIHHTWRLRTGKQHAGPRAACAARADRRGIRDAG
jgi:hypothetical protein